jgi:replicative DNA helicase
MDNGDSQVYNGIGQNFEAITKKIEEYSERSIILIDYMQRLPAPNESKGELRYLQIQNASAKLLYMAIERQLVVISGAQRKREDSQNTQNMMNSIRESGDIEQDTHNLIILDEGMAHVAKAREGDANVKQIPIKAEKQFIFWEISEKCKQKEKDDNNARGKNEKPDNKPTLKDTADYF